jgi:hypothetical protein
MSVRYLTGGLFAAILCAATWASAANVKGTDQTPAPATNATTTRQAIRDMPLLERPNRPGHFYGNTVRRIHDRREARESRMTQQS